MIFDNDMWIIHFRVASLKIIHHIDMCFILFTYSLLQHDISYWYVFDLLHAFSMLLFKSFPQSGANLRKWWLWKSRLQELSSVFAFWIIRNHTKVLRSFWAMGFSKASCQDRKSTESFCWLKILIKLRWWKSGKLWHPPAYWDLGRGGIDMDRSMDGILLAGNWIMYRASAHKSAGLSSSRSWSQWQSTSWSWSQW